MAKFAVNTLKAKKAAILFDFNSPYGRGLTDYFELSFARQGGQIVAKRSYMQGDVDFKGQLSSIQAAVPDVIYIPGYYSDVALIAKQARQWDWNNRCSVEMDGRSGTLAARRRCFKWIVHSTHYSVDDPSPAIQQFVREYKQRYGNLFARCPCGPGL